MGRKGRQEQEPLALPVLLEGLPAQDPQEEAVAADFQT